MGTQRIAGVDEAGRGPLAGPVVAAAVVFPEGYFNPEIDDSKRLSATKRKRLVEVITRDALDYSIVAVGPRRIEKMNIRAATMHAMRLSVERITADHIRIDGNMLLDNYAHSQEAIVKGDQKHVDIAAASILAKVHRDNLMQVLSVKYPGFSVERHAGYPTPAHKQAVAELGPTLMHRLTFKGVRECIPNAQSALVSAFANQLS